MPDYENKGDTQHSKQQKTREFVLKRIGSIGSEARKVEYRNGEDKRISYQKYD